MNMTIDILGWTGGLMVLVAYGLISSDRMTSRSPSYHFLNAIGSIFLVVNTAFYGAYPSTFVNVIWLSIAALGFFRVARAAAK